MNFKNIQYKIQLKFQAILRAVTGKSTISTDLSDYTRELDYQHKSIFQGKDLRPEQ